MQILIEIPESEIPKQQDIIEIPLHFIDGKVCEAGNYGFEVLPKGHGRLMDEKVIIGNAVKGLNGIYDLTDMPDYIAGLPSTILADKEEQE